MFVFIISTVFSLIADFLFLLMKSYSLTSVLYYSLCAVMGTPLAQPLLSTIWLIQKEVVMGPTVAGIPFTGTPKYRLSIFLKMVAQHLFWRPILGMILMADVLLLSGLYDKPLKKPFFVKSGARSGSTVMGQVLDCDDNLSGVAQWFAVCPYLTFWMLVDNTIGKWKGQTAKDKFFADIPKGMPEEVRVRHEFDMQKPDTFDVAIGQNQLWGLPVFSSILPHPAFEKRLFLSQLPEAEQERAIDFIEEVMQKWALWSGLSPEQHVLLKSHLVATIPALKRRYPDATFITITREPKDMYVSCVPFLAAVSNATGPYSLFGKYPPAEEWDYMCYYIIKYYKQYCDSETTYINDGTLKAIPFKTVIKNIPASMDTVYEHASNIWGDAKKTYVGSIHEQAVQAREADPVFLEEKKWRKSMKATYPSADFQKVQAIATNYAKENGLPVIDMDTDATFVEYRKLC